MKLGLGHEIHLTIRNPDYNQFEGGDELLESSWERSGGVQSDNAND
jgi:hypothetical protein